VQPDVDCWVSNGSAGLADDDDGWSVRYFLKCFWKKSLMLTKAVFIWSKIQ